MTRLFLAAGVAALAITAPVVAKPPGGGHGNQAQAAPQKGGGGGARVQRGGGGGGPKAIRGGGGGRAQAFRGGGGGGRAFSAPRMQQRSFAGPRQGRVQRFAGPRMERGHGQARTVQRQQFRGARAAQNRALERQQFRGGRAQQVRSERQQLRANRVQQVRNERQQLRANRALQAQNRGFERQQLRANRFEQIQGRQALRANRFEQVRNREAFRNELRANRIDRLDNGMLVRDQRFGGRLLRAEDFRAGERGFGIGGCPPGLASKGCMPPGQAAKLLGTPLGVASRFAALGSVPFAARYLYPDTDDYFYRYGDGYLYRVDRDSQLINALLPLAFGGYWPGSYLPNYYMSSYVPAYYGFNSFYRDYDDDCYRYGYGVVYEVDCFTGFVKDVIPLYAGGYGVGQILPTSYAYYNVPYQYRSLYYDTPDYNYWYSPGAIYQYDPGSSVITSVAALLSPGFTIGQPLPVGYSVYNVPYGYRATYYDTPAAWYRYNNGYIYQVDPSTMLVTAIVASLLT